VVTTNNYACSNRFSDPNLFHNSELDIGSKDRAATPALHNRNTTSSCSKAKRTLIQPGHVSPGCNEYKSAWHNNTAMFVTGSGQQIKRLVSYWMRRLVRWISFCQALLHKFLSFFGGELAVYFASPASPNDLFYLFPLDINLPELVMFCLTVGLP